MTLKEYAESQKKATKYGSKKVTVDGISFDSITEAARYLELLDRQKRGEISGLLTQVPIALRDSNLKRIGLYNADLSYTIASTGEHIIEDVKGVRTAVFNLKAKMVAASGIDIKIILASDIPKNYLAIANEIQRLDILIWRTRDK